MLAAAAVPAGARHGGGTGTAACGNNGTVTWTPAVIWPPNHKMVPVTFSWTEPAETGDTSNDTNSLTVNSITSTGIDDSGSGQPSSKQGSDTSSPPITGQSVPHGQAATVTAYVRAERSGHDKAGRTYTFNLTCHSGDDTDQTAMAVSTVPHDMGNHNGSTSSSSKKSSSKKSSSSTSSTSSSSAPASTSSVSSAVGSVVGALP